MTRCTFPAKQGICGRRSVVTYIVNGEPLPRCSKHDGPKVKEEAERRGYERLVAA